MIYICVQPDINYFHWQVEVMLQNFTDVGLDIGQCHIVFMHCGSISQEVQILQNKFPKAKFFYYLDDREDKSYIPSLKPYGMYKHFDSNTIKGQIFYHDCDIIFHRQIDYSLFKDQKIWFMSNTIGYIGYDYCLSKGEEQLKGMAKIVGISTETIQDNQNSSGGAQYIMFEPSNEYWYKVYKDSNSLYKFLNSQTQTIQDGIYPIQKWCAEMWATLWNIWYFNHKTQVHRELDFCFATNPIDDFGKMKILHNAGVVESEKHRMFFKGEFINKNPLLLTDLELSYVDPNYCSWQYKEAVRRVAEINK